MSVDNLKLGTIFRFDTVGEMLAANGDQWDDYQGADEHWAGDTRENARVKAITGDDAMVKGAERLLEKFTEALPETSRKRWAHEVAGVYPDVPRFLMGADPRVMRVKKVRSEDTAPIRVFVDACCSAGVNVEQMETRGAAVIAFLMAVSAQRPVELYYTSCAVGPNNRFGAVVTRMASKPLDLATSAYLMGRPAFFRHFLLDAMSSSTRQRGGNGTDCVPVMASNQKNVAAARKFLALEPDDVFLPGAHREDPIVRDPEGWLRQALADARLTETEA